VLLTSSELPEFLRWTATSAGQLLGASDALRVLIRRSVAARRLRRGALGVGLVAATGVAIVFGLQAKRLRDENAKTQQSISNAMETAKVIVFEVDDELQRVAGASPVRERLLKRSRELVARLRQLGDLPENDKRTAMAGKVAEAQLALERGHLDEDENEDEKTDAAKAASEEDDEGDEGEEDNTRANKTRARMKRGAGVGGDAPGRIRQGRGSKPAEKADDHDEDDLVLPSAVKNAMLRVLAQALERLMGVANRVKEAEEPDDETAASVPDDLASELEDIGELLEDIGEELADPAAKADGKKPGATKAGSAKAGVAKVGSRMAKDRLDRFQKALALLSDVLKELTEAKAPADPTAGAAENKLAKRDADPAMRELAANLGELTELMKRQTDELGRLRKTHATSNAIPVDGGRRREPQDVSWPLDMNRPISRDSVAKTISFYDNE
jgi:hypothetical protein